MSIPKTLDIPAGVDVVRIEADGIDVAAHVVRLDAPRAHVLLVPGWTGSKEDFTQVLPLLADAGFDVTAYDQRGQYETVGLPDDDYTLEMFARDAAAVAAAASPLPSHLLGHSFGGLVAQRAAVDHIAQWRSLSLLGTGPGALGESPQRPLKMLVQAFGKVPLLQIHELREQGVRRPAQITRFLAKRFTSNSVPSLKAITQLLLDAPDIIDQVAALDLPVWVGRGQDDDAWGHGVQASMAQRLDETVHVIEASAHSPGVENPQGLADAWLPFLERHSLEQHS